MTWHHKSINQYNLSVIVDKSKNSYHWMNTVSMTITDVFRAENETQLMHVYYMVIFYYVPASYMYQFHCQNVTLGKLHTAKI